jgi:hypothetical protein
MTALRGLRPRRPFGVRIKISDLNSYTTPGDVSCSVCLDPGSGNRWPEIPQWMFDASAVCLIRLASSPAASCEALRELKELIGPRGAIGNGEVVQAQHQSLSHTGGSDAKPSEVTPSKPTPAVSATDRNAALGELSRRGSAPGRGPSGAVAAGARRKRRTRGMSREVRDE